MFHLSFSSKTSLLSDKEELHHQIALEFDLCAALLRIIRKLPTRRLPVPNAIISGLTKSIQPA